MAVTGDPGLVCLKGNQEKEKKCFFPLCSIISTLLNKWSPVHFTQVLSELLSGCLKQRQKELGICSSDILSDQLHN